MLHQKVLVVVGYPEHRTTVLHQQVLVVVGYAEHRTTVLRVSRIPGALHDGVAPASPGGSQIPWEHRMTVLHQQVLVAVREMF